VQRIVSIAVCIFAFAFPRIFIGCRQGTLGTCPEGQIDFQAPAPEPVTVQDVPRPPSVKRWITPRFSPDGQWIAFSFTGTDSPDKSSIGIIRPDGTGFQCLSCFSGINTSHPDWFGDMQRMLVRSGDPQIPFYILDRAASVLYPITGVTTGLEENRFPVLSPDEKKLVWTKVRTDGFHIVMGNLVTDTAGYHVEDVRLLYPPPMTNEEDPEQWGWAGAWYEAKSFTDGGKSLFFSGSRDQGGNLDGYLLDLETGVVIRVTNHPEWDEGGQFSPDGQWLVFETTRAHDVLSVVATVPIPPFVDFALVLPVTNITLSGPMFAPHEPYLLDRTGDRGKYFGQRLSAAGDEGWAIRGAVYWHHDGTKVVWGELLNPTEDDTRIRIATLVSRHPVASLPVRPTPTPQWAPLMEDVPPRADKIRKTLRGKSFGSAVLDIDGTILSGTFTMSFNNYSWDGQNILNGMMKISVPVLGKAQWSGDIRLSGCHTGFVKIDMDIDKKTVKGRMVSEMDGVKHEKTF